MPRKEREKGEGKEISILVCFFGGVVLMILRSNGLTLGAKRVVKIGNLGLVILTFFL